LKWILILTLKRTISRLVSENNKSCHKEGWTRCNQQPDSKKTASKPFTRANSLGGRTERRVTSDHDERVSPRTKGATALKTGGLTSALKANNIPGQCELSAVVLEPGGRRVLVQKTRGKSGGEENKNQKRRVPRRNVVFVGQQERKQEHNHELQSNYL